MSPTPTPHSTDARSADSPRVGSLGTARGEEALPPRTADPEAALAEIRSLLTDDFLAAQQLALEAAARFPRHAGIQNAKRILNGGTATIAKTGPKPDQHKDVEWLRNPPESVRGKWVALVGGEIVGSADDFAELAESLRSKKLPRTPLVHRID